jgi:hypothetical protein
MRRCWLLLMECFYRECGEALIATFKLRHRL